LGVRENCSNREAIKASHIHEERVRCLYQSVASTNEKLCVSQVIEEATDIDMERLWKGYSMLTATIYEHKRTVSICAASFRPPWTA
jgi:hypothetical protein